MRNETTWQPQSPPGRAFPASATPGAASAARLEVGGRGVVLMNMERLDLLENMRHTLAQEARRCHTDTVYVDFLYREYLHYTARVEREWRDYEGGGVVPARYRSGRDGRDSAARERRAV